MEELLIQILEEHKKTNALLKQYIDNAKEAHDKAMAMNEEQRTKLFSSISQSNPKVADMLKGFMGNK